VPMVRVIVGAGPATDEQVLVTVDNVLAFTFTDLVVAVAPTTADPPAEWLLEYFGHNHPWHSPTVR
jgi:hypothetical protein